MGIAAAAGIGAVASIGSAAIGSHAAKKAANTQADAANHAADLQNQQYQQSREDMAPWRLAGGKAIGQLSDMLQPGYDYTTSPGYQFRVHEGMKGVENSAAAHGILQSGGTLKGLMRYGQDYAANDFQDQFNRVASVATGGQQVNGTLASLGQNAANNAGNYLTQGANARASGYIGQANQFGNALNNVAGLGIYGAQNGLFGGGNSGPSWSLPQNFGFTTPNINGFVSNPDYTYG